MLYWCRYSDKCFVSAKSAILQEARVARSSDATLVGSLVRQAYLNRTYAFNAELEAKISAVTPEMAKAALNKYVTPENLVVVRAGTFGK